MREVGADGASGAAAGVGQIRKILLIAAHMSVARTLYRCVRHRGLCIVARGAKLKISARAHVELAPGSRLYLGFGLSSFTGSPCFLRLEPGAQLSVEGTVQLLRATRVYVAREARLDVGHGTYLNDSATVVCTGHTRIGRRCAISLNTAILDGNIHELTINGRPRSRVQGITVGDDVWIGLGATIMPGVKVGDRAIIGAGSVVTSDVPSQAVVAGNPARVIAHDAEWVL
jgi:acetyltransferase-like isoleucine patch superfamily enzyme